MAERLFVDLLFRSSRKYPSWDPEVPVAVGDYGHITEGQRSWKFWKKQGGIFVKDGNIYKDGIAEEYCIPEPTEQEETSTESQTWVASNNASEVNLEGEQTPTFTHCKIRAAYKVTSGDTAVLAMGDVATTTIDPPSTLRRLLDHPSMKGCVVVSEVHKCSSYAYLLATKGDSTGTIAIGLAVDSVEGSPDTAHAKWVRSSKTGNFKSNVSRDGERSFYPLFKLVSVAEGGVSTQLRGDLDEELPLPDAEPPWSNIASPSSDENEAATWIMSLIPKISFNLR